MRVELISRLDRLAEHAETWDFLAGGVPFRSWAWLSTWWRYYGMPEDAPSRSNQLFALCVFDRHDELVGMAPGYLENSAARGRVVRFLGSGDVCSDHMSLLCRPGKEEAVAQAIAEWLTEPCPRDPGRWDLLEWTGVDAGEPVMKCLAENLAIRGNTVHTRPGPNCWRLELPTRWEDYLARLSRNRRKKIRQTQRRMLETGRAVLHSVERISQVPRAMDILIELHQRRRHGLGEPGCFASPRFDAFHREVMPELLRSGQLRLWQLELDGCPAAAEYQVAGGGVIYAYQSGVDPEALDHQPGLLLTMVTLRGAIEGGYRAFDFLRGDEPYKASFRAAPRPGITLRVVPRRTSARLRHGLWTAGSNVKQWIKSGLKLAGSRPAPKHA